jgi:hypothetical protein
MPIYNSLGAAKELADFDRTPVDNNLQSWQT